jgi:glutaredoxin
MLLVVGKKLCPQCVVLTEVLDNKKIEYQYILNTELSNDTIDILKQSYKTYPMVLEVKQYANFKEMLAYYTEQK